MANERILVSPGVLTTEIDGTTLPATPLAVGPAVVGPREKGPAMVPVRVKDLDTDAATFGIPKNNGRDFSAYASRAVLKQQTVPTNTVRLLGMSDSGVVPGFTVGGLYALGASGSNVVALIASSGTVALAGNMTSSIGALTMTIAGFNGGAAFTASLNRSDTNYLGKILNTEPSLYSTQKHFLYSLYDYAPKTPLAQNAFYVSQLPSEGANFQDEFITGSTTMVISQPFAGIEYDLFGIGSIFAGDSANVETKVTISAIRATVNTAATEYGAFNILVRKFDDNDKNPVVLESFAACSLDPNSPNFIGKMIGTRYRVWNKTTGKFDEFGDHENKSKYIYIVPSVDLTTGNVPETALPWGFKGYRRLTTSAVGGKGVFPELPLVQNLMYKNDFSTKVAFGAAIINNASGAVNFGVADKLKHLPKALTAISGTVDTTFSLKYVSASVGNVLGFTDGTRLSANQFSALSSSIQYNSASANPSTSGSGGFTGYLSVANIENTNLAKFTLPIADGFDGTNITSAKGPFSNDDLANGSSYQTYAYKTALDMLSNPDQVEFTELVAPGVYAANVVNYAIDMVTDRGDAFYIFDLSGSNVSDVISDLTTRTLDTNYAAAYYPSLRIFDDVNGIQTVVPASTVIPAVFAVSDRLSYPWFAPAGFSRGSLRNLGVLETLDKLTKTERDSLYENRINPIASFPTQGPVVYGQKTMQVAASALDRINVRRMLLRVRKFIANVGASIVFEPNISRTRSSFINRVTPYLEEVRKNAGIDEFKVIMSDANNTQDDIERNIIRGSLAIRPTRSGEFVLLDFFVTNSVAGFSE